LLVELGLVSEIQLTKLLSRQLSVPWVSLHHIDFSRQLLSLVPAEIAQECCVIPVYVRRDRTIGDTLYLAMEDPTHEETIRRVAAASKMQVKSMIAAPSDLRATIREFYGPQEDPVASVKKTAPAKPPPPRPPQLPNDPAATPRAAPPVPSTRRPAPPAETNGAAAHPASGAPAGPMMALTLLDGTTLQLPARKRSGQMEAKSDEDGVVIRELLTALRTARSGEPQRAPANVHSESVVAALLSLLLKKRLITETEFLEEWRKI
jgi:type IV pilus assembly protein PilB